MQEIEEKVKQEYETSNLELKNIVNKIKKSNNFILEQQSWEKNKNKECDEIYEENEDGSIALTEYYLCLKKLNNQRILEIKDTFLVSKNDECTKAKMDCMKNFILQNIKTIIIPNDIHIEKSKRTAPHLAGSEREKRSSNLSQTAKDESKVIKDELDKKRYKNNPCAKGIKKQLEFFEKLTDEYFDDLFDKAFENCNL